MFSEKIKLTKHNHTVHEGNKDYKCKTCRKLFTLAAHLKKQVRTYVQNVHECDKRCKSFSRAKALRDHIDIVHNKMKKYVCDICNLLSLASVANLTRHNKNNDFVVHKSKGAAQILKEKSVSLDPLQTCEKNYFLYVWYYIHI